MRDFLHFSSFSKRKKRLVLLVGLVVLVGGALLVSRWGGASNVATVICSLGPCTAFTTNTSIAAAEGTVAYNTPATLTWTSNNVENTIAGINCFGKDELNPCGTPMQTLAAGNIVGQKSSNYFTIDSDTYLALAGDGSNSKLYKWMTSVPVTDQPDLPVDTVGASDLPIGYMQFNRDMPLDNGRTVKAMGVYSLSNQTVHLKIGRRGTLGKWDVVSTQPCAVLADQWTDCNLSTPYTITSNSYFAGVYAGAALGQTPTIVRSAHTSDNKGIGDDYVLTENNNDYTAHQVRVSYSDINTAAAPCFGNIYFCGGYLQDLDVNDASGGWEPVSVGTDTYLVMSNSGAVSSKVYEWISAKNCLGSGTTCGSVYQDLGAGTSDAVGGSEVFSVGGETFLAVGNYNGVTSKIFKWLPAGSPTPCFGNGTSNCGGMYQNFPTGTSNARGGFESFKNGSDTYLALANEGAASKLYKWIPSVSSGASIEQNSNGFSGTTAIDRTWQFSNSNTVTHMGVYSVNPGTVTLKIFQRNSAGNYIIVSGMPQTVSHLGTGWEDFDINNITIPSTGTYYAGVYAAFNVGVNTISNARATKNGNTNSATDYTENNGSTPSLRVRYATALSNSCAGDGTYCGLPFQTLTNIRADSAGRGGWQVGTIGSETYLALGNESKRSQLYKFMTSIPSFESSSVTEDVGGGSTTLFDRSWTLNPGATVLSIGAYSQIKQTVRLKIAQRGASGTPYNVLLNQSCDLNAYVWTDCTVTGPFAAGYSVPFVVPSGNPVYAGVYAPAAGAGQSTSNVRARSGSNIGTGSQAVTEENGTPYEVRVTYSGASTALATPCLGNGFQCGSPYQEFSGSSFARYGWDFSKIGTEYFLALGNYGDSSKIFRWMALAQCFGDGLDCGTGVQVLDGAATTIGASLKFVPVNGKAYLVSGGTGVDSKVYKGTEVAYANIAVSPSLTGKKAYVSWAAGGVNSCTVSGTGLSWSSGGVSIIATTTLLTTSAPVDGAVYTITCATPAGDKVATTSAKVRATFWEANDVTTYGSGWPMQTGNCTTDDTYFDDCFGGNDFVSNYGASGVFGAHIKDIGVGTIVGQFTGHGPKLNGGGWESKFIGQRDYFPNPPLKTKSEWNRPVVVSTGDTLDLEWTCQQNQDQYIPNGCVAGTFTSCDEVSETHYAYDAEYSGSTLSSGFGGAPFTAGALKGATSIVIPANFTDTTYSVQCVAQDNSLTFPAMEIQVYATGSPNIPPPPAPELPKTTGCTVYSYDSLNGTSSIATGNKSDVAGFVTPNLLRNTTFTLSCNILGGGVEEAAIRVLIPPVVSVAANQDAAEPATAGNFTVFVEDALDYALPVTITLTGLAANGVDYTTVSTTATIPANVPGVIVNITPVDDFIFEGSESVILTVIDGASYNLGTTFSGTLQLVDNETDQSLPPGVGGGSLTNCAGTAGASTCNLAANPLMIRKGGASIVSWYVDKNITGANGNASSTCAVTANPTTGWTPPLYTVTGANNVWSGSQSLTVNSNTAMTLRCVAPDGTTATSTSLTIKLIPTFQER